MVHTRRSPHAWPRAALPVLLALLLVPWLSACGVPQPKYDAAVKDAHDAHANADDYKTKLDKDEAEIARLNDALNAANSAVSEKTGIDKDQLEELEKAKAAADARQKLYQDLLDKFKKMIDSGKPKIGVRRGRIVLLLHNGVLFDVVKTEIKPKGKEALAEIAATLKTMNGRRFQVSGHTDIVPIKTKEFPSNWELSMERALNVVKYLQTQGVPPLMLSAAGYAEFDPVASNNTPDGQARNRRIEITLQPNIEELVNLPEMKAA